MLSRKYSPTLHSALSYCLLPTVFTHFPLSTFYFLLFSLGAHYLRYSRKINDNQFYSVALGVLAADLVSINQIKKKRVPEPMKPTSCLIDQSLESGISRIPSMNLRNV